MMPIQIIQGGQFGSEAKGAVAAYLCLEEQIDIAVRTGATNAGHTVYYSRPTVSDDPQSVEWFPVKMQQLPVGWVNPNTTLVLGAGALIDPVILEAECEMVSRLTGTNIRSRLLIDPGAGLHLSQHAERSKASGRHHGIGATGKGCSEALIDKIRLRGKGYETFGRSTFRHGYRLANTAAYLNDMWDQGAKIQLEGTQGTLLDLNFGPYPYTTHKPTGPAQWMVEAGLSPALPTDIVMVIRTMPIRVAGNSGPLKVETSWPSLTRKMNHARGVHGLAPLVDENAVEAFEEMVEAIVGRNPSRVPRESNGLDQHLWNRTQRVDHKEALSELYKEALDALPAETVAELQKLWELTTVTKKLRRIGRLTQTDLRMASMLTRPHRVALTFMNYEFPQYWNEAPKHTDDLMEVYIQQVEAETRAPVTHLTFGPWSTKQHVIQRVGVEAAIRDISRR